MPTTPAPSSGRGQLAARLSASASWSPLLGPGLAEAGSPQLPAYRFPYVRRRSRHPGEPGRLLRPADRRRGGTRLMPNLSRLRKAGATARGALTCLQQDRTRSRHAVHRSLARRHGIAGNEVPLPVGRWTETGFGYTSTPLGAEPLWAAAAARVSRSAWFRHPGLSLRTLLGEKRFGGNYGRRSHAPGWLPGLFPFPGRVHREGPEPPRLGGLNGPLLPTGRDPRLRDHGGRNPGGRPGLRRSPGPARGLDTVYWA